MGHAVASESSAASRSRGGALLLAATALLCLESTSCKRGAAASAFDGGDEAAAATAASQAAQEAIVEVVDAGPPRHLIAALRYDTPIFNRRSFPPKTPPPVFDETTQTFRLGGLRKGARIAAKGTLVKTASCTEGWSVRAS